MTTITNSPFRTREQREADRLEKREAVLRAAVLMFNERGFFSTTFDDVAASLGISKPMIYHYLGNKEEVFLECVTRGINELKKAAVKAAKIQGTGVDRLRTFLIHYVQINMEDFGRCVVRTPEEGLSAETSQRFRAMKKEIDLSIRALVQDAMDDGTIAMGDAKLTAWTISGALNWPARWYKPKSAREKKAMASAMVELLLQGVIQGTPEQKSVISTRKRKTETE